MQIRVSCYLGTLQVQSHIKLKGRTEAMRERMANRLLGYPDDARLLIVNADDFGMGHAINEATFRALTGGIVTSTTLMTPCPWSPHALHFLKDHPEIAFGVHLTLVDDYRGYRWGPVASKSEVGSLVDECGYFFHNNRRSEMLAGAILDEIEIEFRAQINVVLAEGLKPSHLDWHCLADGGREDIFALTVKLAREFGLALRVHGRVHAAACQAEGWPTSDFNVLDSYRYDSAGKAEVFARLLRELPAGLSEWAVHPSLGDAEAQAMDPDSWHVRRADYEFVVSDKARRIGDEEGIVFLNFRSLQPFWLC
jgi:predicted glycoside hydrolase/deacetylase ChbG (UPF0249 family)